MRPAQKMARQRLLAERKLPTTDNKDEIRFGNRCKKKRRPVRKSQRLESEISDFQDWVGCPITLIAAWRKASERVGCGWLVKAMSLDDAENFFYCAISSNHFVSGPFEVLHVIRDFKPRSAAAKP
ncbi:hypothetical protein KDX38_17365 [Pseudomonas sp. CDFA 602]|nr:hypothetical protein [Pseudomonas californiensis]MCD5995428.1 hypothetical protein [Pseudomonas californiensis]MCD6000976.1 hypothetical protein [Pseudomonas californiensis]